MESIFGTERATLKKAISQGGEIEPTLDRLFALNAIKPTTATGPAREPASGPDRRAARRRRSRARSGRPASGSHPSGNRRSGSGQPTEGPSLRSSSGGADRRRDAAHADPCRGGRAASGGGRAPRRVPRRAARGSKLPIVLGVVVVLGGLGAAAAVALRGERSLTDAPAATFGARHRDARDSQPAARRARVRRRHAERAAHADHPDAVCRRAAACRSGWTSRATNPSSEQVTLADGQARVISLTLQRVTGPCPGRKQYNDENQVRGRSPADVEQRRRACPGARFRGMGAILAGLVVLGLVAGASWLGDRQLRRFLSELDEQLLGQASASMEQLLARQRDAAGRRGQGARRRQPDPRDGARAEVRRGDRAGHPRGSAEVVGGDAARGRRSAGKVHAVAGATGLREVESRRVAGGQERLRPPDLGRLDAARSGPGRRPRADPLGRSDAGAAGEGAAAGAQPARDRRHVAGRDGRGLHRRARSPRRSADGHDLDEPLRAAGRTGRRDRVACPREAVRIWCASAAPARARPRRGWPGWCRVHHQFERARLAAVSHLVPDPARARCCFWSCSSIHDETTEEAREQTDSTEGTGRRHSSPSDCRARAPLGAPTFGGGGVAARGAAAAGAGPGAARGDGRGRRARSPAGRRC